MWNFFSKSEIHGGAIHLDYASATPVAPEVEKAMQPYFTKEWANPSAIYKSGVRARGVVEEARTSLARLLKIRREGVYFTSGGTESNNHALIGLIESLHEAGRAYADMEIITTPIEHPSILEACAYIEKRGVRIVMLAVNEEGKIDEASLRTSLTPKTVLITFAYVNSEIGVIQEVKRITRQVRAWNTEHDASVRVHLDAAQAPLWLSCEMDMLGVDMITLDAGKCYGPKGIGVLALRHGIRIAPFMHGGGQEGGMRSGTENVPSIVGCAEALLRAQSAWKERSEKATILRDYMFEEIKKELPTAVINGSRESRVANNVHISIPGIDAEYAVITLDVHGIAASTKSACGSITSSGSYVVRAITQDDRRATSTIRFTLGETTTKEELNRAVHVLKEHVLKMASFQEKLSKA